MLMKCRGSDEGAWVCNRLLGSEAVTASSQGRYVSTRECQLTLAAPFQPSLSRFYPSDLAAQINGSGAHSRDSFRGSVLVLNKCPAW